MKNGLSPRIAIVGTGTLEHVPKLLAARCAAYGIHPHWYVAPYQQYQQEVLNPASGLYAFAPDLLLILVDTPTLLQPREETVYRLSVSSRRRVARAAATELIELVTTVAERTRSLIVVHNLEVPSYPPLGILESKQEFGIIDMVRWVNRTLERSFCGEPRVFVFDYDGFLSRVGKQQAKDDRWYYLADMRLSPGVWSQLGDEYVRYLLALYGRTKKCLVVDLDNTLWGGVVGEDGFEGIQLGSTPPGNAFVAFQRSLLALFERGILLAINSHNNPAEALKVIRDHPAMVLREKHIAAMAINWDSKAENVRVIARELNLGLDSLVYLDDDPAQRLLVRQRVPEVEVVELPSDPAQYVRTLQQFVGLDALQLTAEDRRRGVMYATERRRRESKRQARSVQEFVADLNIRVSMQKADQFSMPRLAQLTQRTNQFHLTLARYTETELTAWVTRSNVHLYAIQVADRFGDQGISGALGVARNDSHWDLALFLLSCRVLGKGIEEAVLGTLAHWAREAGSQELRCAYVPSEKNVVARHFLEQAGFVCTHHEETVQQWRLSLKQPLSPPACIEVLTA